MRALSDKPLVILSSLIAAAAFIHFATLIKIAAKLEYGRVSYEWGYVSEMPEIGKIRILPVSGRSIRSVVASSR